MPIAPVRQLARLRARFEQHAQELATLGILSQRPPPSGIGRVEKVLFHLPVIVFSGLQAVEEDQQLIAAFVPFTVVQAND